MASERPITIKRAKHDHDNPYYMMTRATSQDKTISYNASGVLNYLLSKPDDWEVIPSDLQREQCGRDKVYTILRELIRTGYMRHVTIRDERSRIKERYYELSERPLFPQLNDTDDEHTDLKEALGYNSPQTGFQYMDNTDLDPEIPDTENPDTENPTLHNTESQSTELHNTELDTTYPFGLQNSTENTPTSLILSTTGSAQDRTQSQDVDMGNILIDNALPIEKATVPPLTLPVSTPVASVAQVLTNRLPPRPLSRNSANAPQINLNLPPMAKEKGKPIEYWKFDEDGNRIDAIPPENGLTPAEKNDFIKDETKDKRRKGDHEPTPTEIARDEWTRAVLRQFGMQDKFDYANDYKSTHHMLYITSAKAMRLAAKDYMKKNPNVTISPAIVDAMWGGEKKTGWLFTDKKLDPERSSPAVLSRYFLEYISSKSSPILKAKEAEAKAAQIANIVFEEDFDISKFEAEARQMHEAEKVRQTKLKAYNPLNVPTKTVQS